MSKLRIIFLLLASVGITSHLCGLDVHEPESQAVGIEVTEKTHATVVGSETAANSEFEQKEQVTVSASDANVTALDFEAKIAECFQQTCLSKQG